MAHYFGFAGFLHQSHGDVEKILEVSDYCIALSKENGYHLNMAWANMQKGWTRAKQGNPEEGLEMLQQGLELWQEVGMVCFVPYMHALIAEIDGQLNQPTE